MKVSNKKNEIIKPVLYARSKEKYNVGDTIPDFTLYTLDNKQMNIKSELEKGKPVILISGSYTCPVFRKKSTSMNQIINDFQDKVKIYIVYVVEAHPVVDVCPYTNPPGEVWVTKDNEKAGILYRQPENYGERKAIVGDMLDSMNILPDVLLDGPCNEWWNNFGPAPVIAYLIDTNGIIAGRHSWYNRFGKNMNRDIRNLLSKTNDFDKTTVFNCATPDNSISGMPGDGLELITYLENTTDKELFIDVKLQDMQIPMDWMVNFTADEGLAMDMDSIVIYLAPYQQKELRKN